jgi:hypothetical protein
MVNISVEIRGKIVEDVRCLPHWYVTLDIQPLGRSVFSPTARHVQSIFGMVDFAPGVLFAAVNDDD